MRTLTTLTAAAALIAAISVAAAQSTMSQPKSGTTGGSSMTGSAQVTGTGKYCIETSPCGALNCKYASLDACQQAAKGSNANCSPNPKAGTTGAK